jgi:toxin CptA
MTIAVSVLVRPSRILLTLVTGMSASVSICGGLFFFAPHDVLSLLSLASLLTVCIVIGLTAFFLMCSGRKAFRIDISGTGQIRLNDTSRGDVLSDGGGTGSQIVQLLSNSTLWATLLILRLQSEAGRVTVVPVFPDSLGCDDFRAVCVACRWIAAQNIRSGASVSGKNLLSD